MGRGNLSEEEYKDLLNQLRGNYVPTTDKLTEEDYEDLINKLKEYNISYDDNKIRKIWDETNKIDTIEIVYKMQPLINKKFKTKNDQILLAIYFKKYIKMGYDPEYFTSGAGAPNNCIIL